jgi:NAD(P)-dependent dehydrogenase (short-subunit alcohol dehydrogenase family)
VTASANGSLRDKVVVVTGSGRGIGRETALLMAAEVAKVVVNDVGGSASGEGSDVTPAHEVASLIGARGGDAIANTDSVSEWDSAHALVEAAVKAFGRIDVVVNNAGIVRDRIFHKMEESDWDAVIGVHLKGSFNVSRAAARYFREQGGGCYVHMTSTSGLIGNVGQANYAAAKLGIVGLSTSIALDMARYNVRSNCVSPFAKTRLIGTIPTETPEQKKRAERLNALEPATIAPLVALLAGDLSAGVTGQVFGVRGNEVFLFNHPRPIRSMHADGGWTPQRLAARMIPAFKSSFTAVQVSADVFCWDPV